MKTLAVMETNAQRREAQRKALHQHRILSRSAQALSASCGELLALYWAGLTVPKTVLSELAQADLKLRAVIAAQEGGAK